MSAQPSTQSKSLRPTRFSRDASTYQGGVARVLRRIERDGIEDVWMLRDWQFSHRSIPLSERTAYWQGMDSALVDAIVADPDAGEGAG